MYSLLFLALSALGVALALTPLVRNLFLRAGLVDHPDQHRKTHARPIPRVGGISIAVAYAAAFLLLMATPLSGGALLADHLPLVWKLLPAAGLVFATGLVDDLAGLRPRQKLAGLAAAAIAAWWAGARITAIAGVGLGDAPSLALTLVWLVGCANAFNLIDGVDGLAAGIGLFATLTSLVAALLHGNWALALATAPLAGALLGFLRYNFNPASIFLGDCGSLLIGFLLGCYGVLWSQKSATLLGMTAPLMVMAIPIADVLLSIARRFLSHQPIFGADRGHIHHRLLDRGLTPKVVALTLYAVCGLGAVFSLLASVSGNRYPGLLLILFSGAVWMGVRHLGYVEFAVARRVFLGGPLRRLLGEQIRLQRLEQAIQNAVTPTDCWLAIREAATGFGFDKVHA
ncbi:MAG: MraY family glycosyltransferase, partial [Bryobacteraceae bacterium]